MGVWQLMFCWSVVFGVGFMAIEWGWLGRAEKVDVFHQEVVLGRPQSDAYRQVRIQYNGEIYRDLPLRGTAVLTLATNERDGVVVLIWDSRTQTCRLMRDGKREGPERAFNAEAILNWMRACGVNVDGRVQEEAGVIVTDTERAAHRSFAGSSDFGSQRSIGGGSSRRVYPVQALVAGLWLCWAAGLVLLWRRSRRAWRVAVVARGPDVAEQDVARVDEWGGRSLRGFE
jgi:hypothetical protein